MATYDVDQLPLGSTRTLGSDTDQITIRKTHISASNFSKTLCLTNLDTNAVLYLSFRAGATNLVEEYAIQPGVTVNIDTSRSSVFDLYVRGTSGQMYSYLIV